ncbi:hypothetical protein PCH70_08510 [Pseudomonas cichorii JBC1]|nr:hypothetical protein PCH70_08510 [Pseudomonas cichorii JBC1]
MVHGEDAQASRRQLDRGLGTRAAQDHVHVGLADARLTARRGLSRNAAQFRALISRSLECAKTRPTVPAGQDKFWPIGK